jgi:hypothetical protein
MVVTWPQAAHLATHASDHYDVYFNMWRFGWVAHAALSPAATLLDGNIFYPAPNTLLFSDALPVPAAMAVPLLWAGVPPVLVHNLVLFAGILLSAIGMFVLARSLTGSAAAGVTAGLVFGFASYRFEHYSHMELQWSIWIPWAFWALERVRAHGRARHGIALGVFLALQFMSSIYYGIYLAVLVSISVLCGLLVDFSRKHPLRAQMTAFGAAASVALVLCTPYARPYLSVRPALGIRGFGEVAQFSARPASYLAASSSNVLFGKLTEHLGGQETRLFPGALALMLTGVCIFSRRSPRPLIYIVGLIAAFELSLGVNGLIYPLLYQHAPGFSALRAPARLGIFVLFFVAVLAAFGHVILIQRFQSRMREVAAAIWVILAIEYCVAPLDLVPYPNRSPPLYAWLARQPRGLVAELPLPMANFLPGDEARYAYMSTFHWQPLVNGYSGYYPRSYLMTLERLRRIRAGQSVGVLRRTGVKYVIVHFQSWDPQESIEASRVLHKDPSVQVVGQFDDGRGIAIVFQLNDEAPPVK